MLFKKLNLPMRISHFPTCKHTKCVQDTSTCKILQVLDLTGLHPVVYQTPSCGSPIMSAKHQENDTPVKASHLLLVDCGVSSSGSRTLSVGEAPQAREICVVPQEQCGVVTLCDLPKAEGQGSPLPKTAGATPVPVCAIGISW